MNERDREPEIHETAYIAPTVKLGDWSKVGPHTRIFGKVEFGRAAYITDNVTIGGGQQEFGSLKAGDFVSVWEHSFINIAAPVSIGDEVGLGMGTKIFTHGNYLSELDGFPFIRAPVSIGSNVWLPNAIVLPKVGIGNNVVVSAGSLVTRDLPGGCLAGGNPARIIEMNRYPELQPTQPILKAIVNDAKYYGTRNLTIMDHSLIVSKRFVKGRGKTVFHPRERIIEGAANFDTEVIKNLFRRRGIRFRYYDNKGVYTEWD